MVLNSGIADPSHLKVMILSCPKTGNTWLRWLIHHAYGLPIVNLPLEWSDEHAKSLPDAFVTHQHLWPSEDLVRWLVRNNVVVLTTVRHPADTLLSYFHFAKWQDLSEDPSAGAMTRDGDRPGKHTLKFAQYAFAQTYAISLSWARLGAHVVRYEDLLTDPVSRLREVCSRIAPLDEHKITAAALLCKPELMTAPGLVDPRHIRTGTARRWVKELPAAIVDAMADMEPYKAACGAYSYDWDAAAGDPPRFDYDSIDPFRGRRAFDNGEPIGPSLTKIYLHEVGDSSTRWPDPTVTAGDSFWNWLLSPSELATLNPDFPPDTFTNLMAIVHRMRPDLQVKFPDPVNADRPGFLAWYLGQAPSEFEFPWGLISPVMDRYCDELASANANAAAAPFGRITRIAVLDSRGWETADFACGDDIRIELELVVDQPVEKGVIGYSLRGADGRLVFGTNTTMLGSPPPTLGPGTHSCAIQSKLTIAPQSCYVSVGFARYVDRQRVEAIHRIYDHKRITVSGAASAGAGWCETAISLG